MIATSIEQSKKLLELGIDPKTADMWWNFYSLTYDNGHAMELEIGPWLGSFNWFSRRDNIPAWSLSALLRVIPSSMQRCGKAMFLRLDKVGAYNLYYSSRDRLDEVWFTKENPIDACVEMIEWLIDNGYECLKIYKETEK